jgi:hypothetical protein
LILRGPSSSVDRDHERDSHQPDAQRSADRRCDLFETKIFCATARQLTDLGQDRRRSGQTASGWPKSIAAAVSKARIAWLPRVAPVW